MALKYKVVSTFSPGEGKEGEQLWFPKRSWKAATRNQVEALRYE